MQRALRVVSVSLNAIDICMSLQGVVEKYRLPTGSRPMVVNSGAMRRSMFQLVK